MVFKSLAFVNFTALVFRSLTFLRVFSWPIKVLSWTWPIKALFAVSLLLDIKSLVLVLVLVYKSLAFFRAFFFAITALSIGHFEKAIESHVLDLGLLLELSKIVRFKSLFLDTISLVLVLELVYKRICPVESFFLAIVSHILDLSLCLGLLKPWICL